MSAQRHVTTGALSSSQALVGDAVGLAIEAARIGIVLVFLVSDSLTCSLTMS
jgi:hypothetical protein